ncbi:MAG: hypothetical protein J6P93_00585 [Alphaproteobacteria bacterium]|nr:hypothetical protein [Alphaproteobacteria bacterium]
MKKIIFLLCLLYAGVAVAQETIALPSTFNENKMVLKKKDAHGNYIPLNQPIAEEAEQEETAEKPQKAEEPKPDRKAMASKQMEGIQKRVKEMNFEKPKEPRKMRLVKPKEEEKQDAEQEEEQPQKKKRTRRMKAVERDYGIQKTTFGEETRKKIEVPKKPTFKTPTMSKAMTDFKKESIQYKECNDDDPKCKTYEVDEEGQVIFK